MPSGIIVSESIPDTQNRYLWIRPLPDGSEEWYTLTDGDTWVLYRSVSAKAEVAHTHSDLTDIVSLLSGGVSGTKVIGGYRFTFNHGVLTGFEPA